MVQTRKVNLYYIIALLLLTIGSVIGSYYFVQSKKEESYKELKQIIQSQFGEHDRIIDLLYYNNQVVYKEIKTPSRHSDKILAAYKEDYNDNWTSRYDDIVKLYSLNSDLTTSLYSHEDSNCDGWRLIVARPSDDGIIINIQFPYGVGYRKQESKFDYLFVPDVDRIISSCAEWLTQDPMSERSRDFQKGKFVSFNKRLKEMETDLYAIPYLSEYLISKLPRSTIDSIWNVELLSPQSYNRKKIVYDKNVYASGSSYPYELAKASAMSNYKREDIPDPTIYPYDQVYNKYYRLYIGTTHDIHLKIFEKTWDVKLIMIKTIVIWWIIGFVIISVSFFLINKISINNQNNNYSAFAKDDIENKDELT